MVHANNEERERARERERERAKNSETQRTTHIKRERERERPLRVFFWAFRFQGFAPTGREGEGGGNRVGNLPSFFVPFLGHFWS